MTRDATRFVIAVGLAVLVLGVGQGISGWSAFNRVHPWGASRRVGCFIAVGGAVLAGAATALSRCY